jgi:uncharacterized membrane protein YdcZ (DUF606 family)
MKREPLDLTSLVGGVVLVAIGVVLLLDRVDAGLNLRFAGLWPLLAGAVGAILLAAGMDDRRRGR